MWNIKGLILKITGFYNDKKRMARQVIIGKPDKKSSVF